MLVLWLSGLVTREVGRSVLATWGRGRGQGGAALYKPEAAEDPPTRSNCASGDALDEEEIRDGAYLLLI